RNRIRQAPRQDPASGGSYWARANARASGSKLRKELAADADGAEAENHVAAGNLAPEALHRSKAGEEQHFVELMLHVLGTRTGNNLIVDHAAVLVDRDVHQQTVRKSQLGIVLFRGPAARRIGKRDELGRLQDIQRSIVGVGLYGEAGSHHLQHHHEDQHGGNKTAGGWDGERTEYIVEQDFRAITETLPARARIESVLNLGCRNLDANRQIRRGRYARGARKQYGQLAIALQLLAADRAGFKMCAHFKAFAGARRAFHRIIEI